MTVISTESPRATRMNCAEAFLRTMADLGCDTFFNTPGRGIRPVMCELHKVPELEHVTALHEYPLGAIADGWARARGTAAFMNVYMSTGTLNAASAIFFAYRDRVPMVVTATQAESWALGASHRAAVDDIVASVRPFTKWAWEVPSAQRIPEALRRAHSIAMTPPMGPVFVSIPVDFWAAEIDYVAPVRTERAELAVAADEPTLGRIAELVLEAESPAFVVGFDAIRAGAAPTLQRLVGALGCAIVAEPEPPRLPAPTLYEYFAGSVPEADGVLEGCDVVVHVGVNTYEPFHGAILSRGVPKRHIWLGTDSFELNKVVPIELALAGPLAPNVEALVGVLERRLGDAPPPAFAERGARLARQIADERAPVMRTRDEGWDEVPMGVPRIVSEIRAQMPPETVVVDHSTTAMRYVREFFPVPDGDQYLTASGSCQGWGLGGAVGAQLADRSRPVVGFVGDGGFMFGVQAWWTAVQYELPLLLVILDNGGWSSSAGNLPPTLAEAGREMHFQWEADYAQLARSLGGDAATVRTPAELQAVLSERLPLSRPLLLDARCRRERVTSRWPLVGY